MNRILSFAVIVMIVGVSGGIAGAFGEMPGKAYVAFYEGGFQIFDVSDPGNPEEIGDYDTARNQALDVIVKDNWAFLADGSGGMQIFDVTDPADVDDPIEFSRPCKARALSLSDDIMYIAAQESLQIYDVTDPTDAFWLTTYEVDIVADQDIVVDDGYAYIACGVHGIKILDVGVPVEPVEIAVIRPPGMARGLAVSDGYAYIAAGVAGLQVVNIADPENPVLVGDGVKTNGAAWGVFIEGKYAYVADRNFGLYIVDVSSPEAPELIGTFNVDRGKSSSVFVMGGYAFITAHQGDLWIVDVSDPTEPVEVKWLRWPGNARAVFVTE